MFAFVLAWVMLHFNGIVFGAFWSLWSIALEWFSNLLFAIRHAENERSRKEQDDIWNNSELGHAARTSMADELRKKRDRRRRRWDRAVLISQQILRVVPRAFEVSVQVSVFVVIIVPLFNQSSEALGSTLSFHDVFSDLRHLHVSRALDKIAAIINFGNSW